VGFYFLQRIAQSLLLLVGVLVLVFFLIRLTGDPVALMVPREASMEQVQAFRVAMGFDRPLLVQFADFAVRAMRLDFGQSLALNRPAASIILERLPATLQLSVASLLLAMALAIPLGVIGGSNPGSPADSFGRVFGLIGQVMPSFWLALILILVFAVNLRWLPSFGRDTALSMVLPAAALGIGAMSQLYRLTRAKVLEIRSDDYIRTARSKGLSSGMIASRHILPNAAISLISIIGIQFTYLLGGSIYIETIFAWPGLGSLLDEAIRARDFPLVQGITVFVASFAIILHLITDLAYGIMDPRIRQGG
jgi:ABC-type dipeptide/oligopeptide/nickel transport system permease component